MRNKKMLRWALLASVTTMAACSSSDGESPQSFGQADAAAEHVGDSDVGAGDADSLAAQGAVSYRVWRGNGQGCFIPAHSVNAPDPRKGQNVTASSVGEVAVDGRDGAMIRCKVKAEGDVFIVSANIDIDDAVFSLDARVAPGQANAEGSIRVQNNHTVTPYVQPSPLTAPPTAPCTIDVETGEQYGVDSGWVWGHFTCTNIVDERSPEVFCSAEGTFLFEKCDG